MADSTCLLRSFSHPSDASREVQQGDPYRALTESISLGRFMSESLAWEKWSAFSHNRYKEEAEKISRPGTVAEKKAYFEAHYKRKAAERAAALLQNVNGVANEVPALVTRVRECNNSFLERKSKGHTQAVSSEQQNRDSREAVDVNGEAKEVPALVTRVEECNHSFVERMSEGHTQAVSNEQQNRDRREAVGMISERDDEIKLDESSILERVEESVLQHDLDNDDQVNCDIERNETDIDSREEASLNRDNREIQLNESSILERGEEPALQPDCDVGVREQGKCDIERNATENNKMEIEGKALRSICNTDMSLKSCLPVNVINQSDGVERNGNVRKRAEIRKTNKGVLDLKTNKGAESSSTKLKISSSIPNESIQGGLDAKTNKAAESSSTKLKIRSIIPKPLRSIAEQKVSMNPKDSTSGILKTKKPVGHLVDSVRRNNAVSSNVPKRSPVSSQNPTRVSVSGTLKKPPAKPLLQCRRSIEQFSKSMIGRGTVDMKRSLLSVISSSSAARSNARPPIISSPFRFRSEERAAKRKMRLEEKIKPKEAEKTQFQTRFKEKVEHEDKKLCQSSIFNSRICQSLSESSTSKAEKIPLTRPQSLKLGKKIASNFTQETSIRRSRRPPVVCSTSKDVPSHSLSVTSLREKATRENASPNIQHSALV